MGGPRPDTANLPARYYLRLGLLLAEQGVPAEDLLARARIPARRLLEPDGSLRIQEVERLSLAALALFRGSDLGWRLGAAIPPAEHATLGHALLDAPTLDAALRLAARYFSLLSPGFLLRYRMQDGAGEVEVMPRLAFGAATLRLHLDTILTGLLAELGYLHGRPLPLLEVECALPAPAPVRSQPLLRPHRCRFGIGGLPRFVVRLPEALLLGRRQREAGGLREEARGRLEAERERLRHRGGLSEWAGMMLREAEGGLPTQAELAGLLGLSTRSFARELEREGVGYRALASDMRMARARAALAAGSQPITALALSLGYGDVANFSRAFRRAHGVSPRAWRAARHPGHGSLRQDEGEPRPSVTRALCPARCGR
ncbi:AraC family transcriptional regulator [Pseudomarimonas salicorniae]|uniref:AraC family transcriptional regulator n=1 Tax=Pseudomarimonas salicorniae TaxID=2933270 RepID=A0ABT0GJG5_9GAMM|nr:AraC family transcriptional regulator [Lysobacter sp. CAU 1642]MCK7594497.1 AraC family transcriptional regulator [Lysobacter sp. CAU 1642]